jgi:hypothetical protein
MRMRTLEEIVCPMCGFRNSVDQERCVACGAKVEVLSASHAGEDDLARRHQHDDFAWKWALIAAAVLVVVQGVVLGLLPLLFGSFDPQGFAGLALSAPLFFAGGVGLGLALPRRGFLEPAVGALLALTPTLAVVAMRTPEGFEATLLAYIVFAAMGVLFALFGALLGQQLQLRLAPRPNA